MSNGEQGGIVGRLQRLPGWAAGALALFGVAIVVAGAVFGYRTYDYVEHDNDFCMSCHLMQDPYDRFAQSAHRGLGCKACHKPTFVARSQMALTQILENPDSLATHAEVPNEKCTDCHIEGDPEKWETIANSAGHRVHFESDDPSLEGLNCVECHSSSVHEFAASSKTCAQSGCHEDSGIQLAGMSDLTIHCVACHGFNAAVGEGAPEEEAFAAVTPDSEACLSCHAMRVLVEMPDDEPHEQTCGSCHNPHEQATPEAAVESCATAACHEQPQTLTPFHRGLEPGVLENCTTCHEAHDWNAHGGECLACHQDVFEVRGAAGTVAAVPSPVGYAAAVASGRIHARAPARGWPARSNGAAGPVDGPVPAVPPAGVRFAGFVHRAVDEGPRPSEPPSTTLPPPQQIGGAAPDSLFRHTDHRGVDCTSCHSAEESHGRVTVTTLRDCRSCHHTQPVATTCSRCHESGSGPGRTFRMARTMSFSVGRPTQRSLPFDHVPHQGLACGECHTSGVDLSANSVDCASCHEEHHEPDNSCVSCHREAPAGAHPTETVHRTCAGSGCHENPPVAGVPDTRSFCLTCHQELADHRPGRACGQCHQVAGTGAGARP